MTLLLFGGDGAIARSAGEQTAKRLRAIFECFLFASKFQNFLHPIEQFLINEWRVLALIYFATVFEMAVVKRVGEHPCHLVF
ncbi:MAG TPA: hypothetical protein PK609_03160 [Candidatus Paceibacterota bacterium]|nr:hypothetical protein [Candidatus Paceibacterota bacterium]